MTLYIGVCSAFRNTNSADSGNTTLEKINRDQSIFSIKYGKYFPRVANLVNKGMRMHKFVYMIYKSLGKYFPYFKLKDTLVYLLHILNWPFWAFLISEYD